MPNEKNLIPGGHVLTVEEASKGGNNSVKSRRRKKNMKELMELLLNNPANTPDDWDLLAALGLNLDELPDEDITNLLIVNAALLKKAKSGDVNAIKELRNIIQDDVYTKHKIKIDKEYLKLEKQKNAPPVTYNREYKGIPANMIAPAFAPVLFDMLYASATIPTAGRCDSTPGR